MILASETISKRNNLPVKLQCVSIENMSQDYLWFIGYPANGGRYFDSFEDVTEFIQEKKLLSQKQLEKIEEIKRRLWQEAETKLTELDRIEEIRNTKEYREAERIAEIRQQLKLDRVANSERDANMLILLHYLREQNADR